MEDQAGLATGATTPTQEPQEKPASQPKKRMTFGTGFFMLGVAILIDILGIVLLFTTAVGGWVIGIVGAVIFGIWFWRKGIPIMSPRSLANWVVNLAVGETITGGIWFGFTVGIIITIIFEMIRKTTGVDAMEVIALAEGRLKKPPVAAAEAEAAGAVATGATAATKTAAAKSVGAKTARGATAMENPVIASEQAHYAAANAPMAAAQTEVGATMETGATPPPQKDTTTKTATHEEDSSSSKDKDEEVATSIKRPRRLDVPTLTAEKTDEQDEEANQAVPFPGAGSPSFGRESQQGGRLLDFKDRRKTASPEVTDEFAAGATPAPGAVNDNVSSDEQIGDNEREAA